MEKKYYEVEISKHTKKGKKNETSMCILGEREPTIEEAGKFLAHDIVFVYKCTHVDAVREISQAEAYSAFNMDDIEDNLPVFGANEKGIDNIIADATAVSKEQTGNEKPVELDLEKD